MSFFSEALSHIPIFPFFFNNSLFPKGKVRKERSRNSFLRSAVYIRTHLIPEKAYRMRILWFDYSWQKHYCVYCLTSPDGKGYFGIRRYEAEKNKPAAGSVLPLA